jgi:hypothetical protein
MFLYSNWGGSEPNNSGYAYMNIGAVHASIQTGQWADDSRDQGYPEPVYDPVIGFFVEYEAPYGEVPCSVVRQPPQPPPCSF